MPKMTKEQMLLGAIELQAHRAEMDEDLKEYASWVGGWAIRMVQKYHLSNEALSMLLDSAPKALVMSIAMFAPEEPKNDSN
jgi:hypothetical protein